MSCNHFIRCLDCKDDEGSLYLNWGEKSLAKLLQQLLKHPEIIDFESCYDCELEIICGSQHVSLRWFKQHKNHKLAIVDEYGYLKPCACGKEHSGNCGLTAEYEK